MFFEALKIVIFVILIILFLLSMIFVINNKFKTIITILKFQNIDEIIINYIFNFLILFYNHKKNRKCYIIQ